MTWKIEINRIFGLVLAGWMLTNFSAPVEAQIVSVDGNLLLSLCNANIKQERTGDWAMKGGTCLGYLTANENVSSVSIGWVLVPPQEACPTTVPTKETVRVNLRPNDSAAAHFNGFDGPSLAQVRYCLTATDVQIAP